MHLCHHVALAFMQVLGKSSWGSHHIRIGILSSSILLGSHNSCIRMGAGQGTIHPSGYLASNGGLDRPSFKALCEFTDRDMMHVLWDMSLFLTGPTQFAMGRP